jgi:hypothetical protein
MKQTVSYFDPAVMLDLAENEMELIPHEQLFNRPQYQKLTERWCAGMFGVGYSRYVSPCEVAVNETSFREDVDIYLRSATQVWEFQLAEVQLPSRRRGLEYKQLTSGAASTTEYTPERGRIEGPQWLANGVRKKMKKNYSKSAQMNLLLYANFAVQGLEHSTLVQELSCFSKDFASLWIVTSLNLCSIFSPPVLGQVNGWGTVRSIEHYYT